jgi:hypothetical protein
VVSGAALSLSPARRGGKGQWRRFELPSGLIFERSSRIFLNKYFFRSIFGLLLRYHYKTIMKSHFLTILLIFSCCFIFCYATAQVQSNSKPRINLHQYEMGAGIARLTNLSAEKIYVNPNFSFKYVMNKNVLRGGISYDRWTNMVLVAQGFLVNVGYERRFFGPKIQALAGIDLGYYRETIKSPSGLPGTFTNTGAGPVIGGIYKFHDRLSFQTELGFFLGSATYRQAYELPQRLFGFVTAHRSFSLHLYYNFGYKK